jgi:hypothetical protein
LPRSSDCPTTTPPARSRRTRTRTACHAGSTRTVHPAMRSQTGNDCTTRSRSVPALAVGLQESPPGCGRSHTPSGNPADGPAVGVSHAPACDGHSRNGGPGHTRRCSQTHRVSARRSDAPCAAAFSGPPGPRRRSDRSSPCARRASGTSPAVCACNPGASPRPTPSSPCLGRDPVAGRFGERSLRPDAIIESAGSRPRSTSLPW